MVATCSLSSVRSGCAHGGEINETSDDRGCRGHRIGDDRRNVRGRGVREQNLKDHRDQKQGHGEPQLSVRVRCLPPPRDQRRRQCGRVCEILQRPLQLKAADMCRRGSCNGIPDVFYVMISVTFARIPIPNATKL